MAKEKMDEETKKKIKLEIRLRIALIGLFAFGGAFMTFVIKRIIEIFA